MACRTTELTTPKSKASRLSGAASSENNEDLQKQVEQQQQQIDQLLAMMKAQQQQQSPAPTVVDDDQDEITPPSKKKQKVEVPASDLKAIAYAPPPAPVSAPTLIQQQPLAAAVATAAVNPLKAMLFIDGTWLYYSIHEREANQCPIILKYGRGWQRKYYFDWSALPRVICSALQHQDTHTGWAVQARPIDIVRASVFTSYKADTNPNSYRFQMYQEMSNANYDVNMMETVGRGEKCVDINIAVEMLHYATVPNAYDVALLLTGDKDFMPAMIRTRQKGRRVALVSMRRGCNKALCETPTDDNNNYDHGKQNIRDYDVVWIEDYLDDLIKPRPGTKIYGGDAWVEEDGRLTEFTTVKVVSDFISQSGISRVSSRDLGRYLKTLVIGDSSVRDDIKAYGGMYQFFATNPCFNVEQRSERESTIAGPGDKSYWVGLRSDADVYLTKAAKSAKLSAAEKIFFDQYSLEAVLENSDDTYFFSRKLLGRIDPSAQAPRFKPNPLYLDDENTDQPQRQNSETTVEHELPEEFTCDYNAMTVAKLKDYCRDNELKVSGTKAQLLDRIQEYIDQQVGKLKKEHESNVANNVAQTNESPEEIGYLEALVQEFCHAKGGRATSRELGRYLSLNKASPKRMAMSGGTVRVTALQQLKERHGSIIGFVLDRPTLFERQDMPPSDYPDEEQMWQHCFYVKSLQSPAAGGGRSGNDEERLSTTSQVAADNRYWLV